MSNHETVSMYSEKGYEADLEWEAWSRLSVDRGWSLPEIDAITLTPEKKAFFEAMLTHSVRDHHESFIEDREAARRAHFVAWQKGEVKIVSLPSTDPWYASGWHYALQEVPPPQCNNSE